MRAFCLSRTHPLRLAGFDFDFPLDCHRPSDSGSWQKIVPDFCYFSEMAHMSGGEMDRPHVFCIAFCARRTTGRLWKVTPCPWFLRVFILLFLWSLFFSQSCLLPFVIHVPDFVHFVLCVVLPQAWSPLWQVTSASSTCGPTSPLVWCITGPGRWPLVAATMAAMGFPSRRLASCGRCLLPT